ncbi:MAG: hypothetical protein JWO27_2920 [Frankiales bacterium]|nr:hypothetical protein [Frankiales bacterium]
MTAHRVRFASVTYRDTDGTMRHAYRDDVIDLPESEAERLTADRAVVPADTEPYRTPGTHVVPADDTGIPTTIG